MTSRVELVLAAVSNVHGGWPRLSLESLTVSPKHLSAFSPCGLCRLIRTSLIDLISKVGTNLLLDNAHYTRYL